MRKETNSTDVYRGFRVLLIILKKVYTVYLHLKVNANSGVAYSHGGALL